MSALSLRLPGSIHRHIREIARNEGVSINQFVSSAVSEKISAIMTENYLKSRAKKAKKSDLKKILDTVPKRKPILGDEL
ncbi:MAG: toxin-antitoxin system HicB family antitoxin [Deltaproteobacteria bacterium CG06_land_8_20_14_3_00_44_19]|nr:MAG: toxin-antitoxin system HicB family antitoxin [Deltaproteobacteria bacterium CG06_land_8_20_14_3_00_44_19]PIZ18922.1 MAG: toxin-antitoxin system HicB family antitoxin [Deltaproteobacteria bacterium CG_4_10_14_0_8_um_filter_43_12]